MKKLNDNKKEWRNNARKILLVLDEIPRVAVGFFSDV
jgi:hypothetical protein